MQGTVRGRYRTKRWQQQEYGRAAQGPKLTLAEKDLAFEGELEGTAAARSSIVQLGSGSTVATGHLLITGRVGDRSGSFVLEESVSGGPGGAKATWRVVPGSGSAELAGLEGEGSWEWQHGAELVTYTLAYRL